MAGKDTIHLPKNQVAEAVSSAVSGEKKDIVRLPPTPELNPRNQILAEIAARSNADSDQDAQETVDSMDEDGNITAASPEETVISTEETVEETTEEPVIDPVTTKVAPASQFDPDQEYDLVVNGRPMKVKGSQIIERGKMALQKESAADQKLELASRLLQEVQAKVTPPAQAVEEPASLSDEQLAEIIQYGTKEQAAQAIAQLRKAGQSSENAQLMMAKQLPQVVSDQLAFHEAAKFVQSEYGDLLTDPYLKQLFFLKENELRGTGDRRPYVELYKEIGEGLRTHFNKPKTTHAAQQPAPKTLEQKVAAKAAAPAAPKLASARMEGKGEAKAPTREEIIAQMQKARGQRAA